MAQKKWAVREILNVTAKYLKDKGIDSPRLCAEVLLAHELRKSRVELYLAFDQPLSRSEMARYRSLIKRRLNREPLQYITGRQEFWSLGFFVSPAVLIPRAETELLVEEAVKLWQERLLSNNSRPRILDLGTGSGAIAISLAKEIEGATLWASDISFDALAVARRNAHCHNVEGRIRFFQGDLWQPFTKTSPPFDMIVTNPPYIPAESFKALEPEVRCYEPRIALDGHEEGMHFIQRIIDEGAVYLNPGGWLLIEMDPDQTERALGLIDSIQSFRFRERRTDYQKRFRVVKAQKRHG